MAPDPGPDVPGKVVSVPGKVGVPGDGIGLAGEDIDVPGAANDVPDKANDVPGVPSGAVGVPSKRTDGSSKAMAVLSDVVGVPSQVNVPSDVIGVPSEGDVPREVTGPPSAVIGVPSHMVDVPSEVIEALVRLDLLRPGDRATFTALTGGVSSDIWKVETGARVFCVKRALPKLKVAQDWRAPVERSRAEWDWFRTVRDLSPNAAPETLGYDETARLSVIGYYPPSTHRLWKAELAAGRVHPSFAEHVGASLAAIHAGTAGDPELAQRFANDATFHAIRLEPYLLATARRHPDLATRLEDLVRRTAGTKRALVHGDVSPKNIFVGPEGPMFLDAECACYGDPAFDVAFCLNHLLLKCLWVPAAQAALLTSFDALSRTYLAAATWENAEGLQARVAHVLPGLFLARVDGKSPVEYVTAERDKSAVRKVARRFLANPSDRLETIRDAWTEELTQ